MTVSQHSALSLSDIGSHLCTIYLLTKNDILTVMVPVTLFSVASAPMCKPIHVFPTILWIWFHVLQFNCVNRIKAPEETKENKLERSLPEGGITMCDATMLRWVMAQSCLALSSLYSIQLVFTSLEIQLTTYWYNEMDGNKHWLLKSLIPTMLYGCTELGGALIAGCNPSKVSETARLAVQLSIAVFASTAHCQDFKDVQGDRIIGRRGVTISSRLVVGLGIPLWSYILCRVWGIDLYCTLAFVAYGCFVGGRFLFLRTRGADKLSCKYYSVWLSFHHSLPGYRNYFHGSDRRRGGEFFESAWNQLSGMSFLGLKGP